MNKRFVCKPLSFRLNGKLVNVASSEGQALGGAVDELGAKDVKIGCNANCMPVPYWLMELFYLCVFC